MKRNDATAAHQPRGGLQHRRWVRIEHQNVAADGRIERLCNLQSIQVDLAEGNVMFSERLDPTLRSGDCQRSPVDPQDFAGVADELGDQQRGVARSAPNVQHPHALRDAGFPEKLSDEGIDKLRLSPKTLHFPIGMSKLIFVGTPALPSVCHRTPLPIDFSCTYADGEGQCVVIPMSRSRR